jgi:hypothetical protein
MLSALVLLAATAQSTTLPSFEAALGMIRQDVLTERARQIAAKNQALAQEIERLARQVSDLRWASWRYRDRLNDLRRRAQNYVPDQPGRPSNDPFLRWDVQQLAYDVRNFARDVDWAKREVFRLSAQATKDPDLVSASQHLKDRAESLRSTCQWLKDDALWAMLDLRHAGFYMEAFDIEREASRASDSSRDLKNEARVLAEKVK